MMKHGKIKASVDGEKMREIVVEMPYIGYRLSVNHCYFTNHRGQRVLYPEVKDWRGILRNIIRSRMGGVMVINKPVTVRLGGVFKDKRSCPDPDNLTKIIGDGVKGGLGINDKDFLWETEPWQFDRTADPMLIITIQGGG